jgi:hypothetical protein
VGKRGWGRKFCEYAQVPRTFVSLINNGANWRTDDYNSHRVRDVEGVLQKNKKKSPELVLLQSTKSEFVHVGNWKNELTAGVSETENVMCSHEWHKYTVLTRWPWR